jgi:zinc transport system substrate-binding protein
MWPATSAPKPRSAVGGALGCLVLVTLAGCGALANESDSQGIDIIAAFYPYAYVAERVAGDFATVSNLTPPGVEPHDLELTPQQVVDLTDADLVIYEAGFQPSIDTAVEQNPPGEALDVTDVVPLRDTGAPGETGADSAGDPHLWLDPTLLIPIARRVADVLSDTDPTHADSYAANAQRLIADLRHLDAEFRAGLSQCERTEIVTSHAAFGYLTSRYGLTMIPIAGLSPDVEPSPQRLAQVQSLIGSDGITTVFSETLGTKAYADTLASDLDVTAAVLDPIEGLADDSSGEDYLSLMRANLAALRAANGCP